MVVIMVSNSSAYGVSTPVFSAINILSDYLDFFLKKNEFNEHDNYHKYP